MAKSDLRIKELCKERGITQAQLAEKIGIMPVSFSQAIARNNFDMKYLKRIADALNVDIVDLFAAGQFKCPHCGKEISLKVEK
jgi:transcriptional regulator with XRE-family HTH domain